ncbi:MAG: hypothetical protein HGB26_02375 [Desulfobulbaceae bacterium]|nr:hypothetical protein [Desulfobulbaceae bacterium]
MTRSTSAMSSRSRSVREVAVTDRVRKIDYLVPVKGVEPSTFALRIDYMGFELPSSDAVSCDKSLIVRKTLS